MKLELQNGKIETIQSKLVSQSQKKMVGEFDDCNSLLIECLKDNAKKKAKSRTANYLRRGQVKMPTTKTLSSTRQKTSITS